MRIITKKQAEYEKEVQFRKLKFLAHRVYEQTLRWNNLIPATGEIPSKHHELDLMAENVCLADDVIV